MKDKIAVTVGTDHTFKCHTDVLGRAGEGYIAQLEIKIPEGLCDCSLYIDFEKPNGETYRTKKIKIENGVALYDVEPFVLTDGGEIKAQVVLQKASGETWKSSIKTYTNLKSINLKEGYLDFIYSGTSDATAETHDVVLGETFYAKDNKLTGTMPKLKDLTEDVLHLKKSDNPTAPTGYFHVFYKGSIKAYVPSTVMEGDTTSEGAVVSHIIEPNLVESNIKEGISLFGGTLVGTYNAGSKPNIQPLTITENGTYTASGGVDGYSPITVYVPSGSNMGNAFKGEWSPETTEYYVGDIVTYEDIYYICIKALPIGAVMNNPKADTDSWERINSTDVTEGIDTCTMEYVSGSDPIGIIYSNGAETKRWVDTPNGEAITVACNTPIMFTYPMGDDAPNVTLTTASGETIQPFEAGTYRRIYSIPSEYKGTKINITW